MTSTATHNACLQQQQQQRQRHDSGSSQDPPPPDPDAEPFVFSESHHSARLMDGLRHLRDSSQFFDVTLVAEGLEFPAHRVVLASYSSYFLAMFTGGMRETSQRSVILHGVSASALEQLIQFVYTAEIKISQENVVEVLHSASHVQMVSVVQACASYLSSHLSLHNCTQVEKITDLFSLTELRNQVLGFMCQHWVAFCGTQEFLELSLEQLKSVLQSDFPVYCAEVQVVRALLAWLNHNLEERACCLSEVLGLVRCDDLRPADLKELVVSVEGRSVAARCPSLLSLLPGMVDVRDGPVPGLANTRGHFHAVLLVGGYYQDSNHTVSNNVLYLDRRAQQFVRYTAIPKMKQANFGVEVLDNRVYIVGGSYDENCPDLTHPYGYCFDISVGRWSSLPPMVQERCRFHLGALGGKLYAVGGEVDNVQPLSVCEVFDPETWTWSSVAPLPAPRSDLAGVSLGGKLYVSGGTDETLTAVHGDMWCYDPALDRWAACAPLLADRADHTMFVFDGRIYSVGGSLGVGQSRSVVAAIDRYSPETDSWETVQRLKTLRRFCSYTLHQGQLLVIGGECSSTRQTYRTVDVLDVGSLAWQPSALTLPTAREHCTVSVHLPRKVATSSLK